MTGPEMSLVTMSYNTHSVQYKMVFIICICKGAVLRLQLKTEKVLSFYMRI